MNIKFAKTQPDAKIPTKGSELSAGYDLYACIKNDIPVPPYSTVKVGTGLSIQPPKGYFGAIFARSGLATNHGLRPANCVGVCDEDYTGEYIVAIHNDSDNMFIVRNGDRIAQLIFLPYLQIVFEEIDHLDFTKRGSNGFGSSGK